MSLPGSPVAEDALMREEKVEMPTMQIGASVEDEEDEDAGPSVPRRSVKAREGDDSGDEKKASAPSDSDDDGDDDLFGGEGGDDSDDDDEQAIRRPNRAQRRQVGSQSPQPTSKAKESSYVSDEDEDNESRRRREQLELRETSAEPPMGYRDRGAGQPEEREAKEASFAIPSLPVRRGANHFYARLPNLLQYRAEQFDEDSFDEKAEDEALQNREGIRIDDAGLRSLLTTSNTIRWRWSGKRDAEGHRKPESNARFVRWNDGSLSLQLGSEFYDITTSSERAQSSSSSKPVASAPASQQTPPALSSTSSLVPPQPIQHLTHLFVKHDGQDMLNVYQAEAPIVGSMTFRPTSITSESHQRLAKAVRQQRGILVKETVTREDPELEKERQEREEKKRKQIRAREAKKRKPQDDDDDDAFWASAGRAVRKGTGSAIDKRAPGGVADAYDDEDDDVEDADATGALLDTVAEDDDDGFVVDDEDEDEDGNGDETSGRRRGGANRDTDMDDEPDEIDKLEAEMERQEALRLASKADRSKDSGAGGGGGGGTSNGVDYSEAEDDEDEKGDSSTAAARRKRVVEESDEE